MNLSKKFVCIKIFIQMAIYKFENQNSIISNVRYAMNIYICKKIHDFEFG